MAVVAAIFRIRRDTATNWTAVNPVLKLGEPGLETDTRKVKYGDGVTAWVGLPYAAADPSDPDLIAIAALISAADKLPYATGTGTWAMADFTAAGRALVDDADADAQRSTLGLGTMATQGANGVAITGGSISNLSALGMATSAAGGSVAGLTISVADTVAARTHLSRFYTQQQGGGLGRTLFYAASPTTDQTRGQFDILTENGANFVARLGPQATSGANSLELYDTAGALQARIHTAGPSLFNGGVKPGSYTVATVPAAGVVGAGTMIYVSNESGGAILAFSDGTNWRRVTDRAVIS